MTYRTEPDGTRVYSNGFRYKPVPDHLRKKRRVKPDPLPEGSVHHNGQWYLPLPVLPEDEREMPYTLPDVEAAKHHIGCRCYRCRNVPRVRKLRKQHLLKGKPLPRRE